MKQHILKKIPLFVTVSVLLACIVFSGCAGRTVITDAQFKSACDIRFHGQRQNELRADAFKRQDLRGQGGRFQRIQPLHV